MMARIKYRIPQGYEESLENTKEKKTSPPQLTQSMEDECPKIDTILTRFLSHL